MTEKARYPKEWGEVPSVTEVLGAFPGPALIGWYRKMAFAEQKAVSDKALDIGKTLHELRIRIEKGEPFEILTKYPAEVQNCVKAYFQWKKERKIPPIIFSELQMFSRSLGIKGTFDDLASDGLKTVLLEYKTSSGIYDEAREQSVVYKKLYTAPDTQFLQKVDSVLRRIDETWIVRFPKDKPDFESKQVMPDEENELWESFNHKLAILKIRKKRDANRRIS